MSLSIIEEPYASSEILGNNFVPLIKYLKRNHINTRFLHSSDYPHYIKQAQTKTSQGVDIAFASSGLAHWLSVNGYQPVLAADNHLDAVIFTSQQSGLTDLQALAKTNQAILSPEAFDIVTDMGHQLLIKHGFQPDQDIKMVLTEKVDRIILSVLSGEYNAGLVAGYDLDLLTPKLRHRINVIARSEAITAHYILLNQGLDDSQKHKIIGLLKRFSLSPESKRWEKSFGSSGFVDLKAEHHAELLRFSTLGTFIATGQN
jgi:ABC-type phosphate/phosphonate transport system substrate-binding protein